MKPAIAMLPALASRILLQVPIPTPVTMLVIQVALIIFRPTDEFKRQRRNQREPQNLSRTAAVELSA